MKRIAKTIAAVALAGTMCTVAGFAATESEHPGYDHGTTNDAMVSDKVDTALDISPKMGTKFTIYLAPDIPTTPPIIHEIPKMGDTGFDQKTLLGALLVAGGCYFVSDGVAVACSGKRKKAAKAAPE